MIQFSIWNWLIFFKWVENHQLDFLFVLWISSTTSPIIPSSNQIKDVCRVAESEVDIFELPSVEARRDDGGDMASNHRTGFSLLFKERCVMSLCCVFFPLCILVMKHCDTTLLHFATEIDASRVFSVFCGCEPGHLQSLSHLPTEQYRGIWAQKVPSVICFWLWTKNYHCRRSLKACLACQGCPKIVTNFLGEVLLMVEIRRSPVEVGGSSSFFFPGFFAPSMVQATSSSSSLLETSRCWFAALDTGGFPTGSCCPPSNRNWRWIWMDFLEICDAPNLVTCATSGAFFFFQRNLRWS